ncbi:DEAD/DEAH box helicase [Mycobacterium koreense]|uniref:Uncharacterized protein n=1 Tax=Mycolicibacillus koreensis TaxID=1069220 RepID=A0A7I7SAN4_9MYCO|nr:DEAD/DEAH box helicase [Mycolicibacillus koreensis]MCV7247568.1 DEAD/DEAH box helicase [Mycolicibacillus koreensis]OSC32850.1 hypothetical protein B8W67_14120 [Mycolicibacillus koreensis]BBY53947.1 hypothetical protein MKOR_11980 [Mycolicibacillus koreensis]
MTLTTSTPELDHLPPADTAPAAAPTAEARKLRDYQVDAANAVTAAFDADVVGPAVVLPTGSGKTTVIAELVRRDVVGGNRVLLMAHRTELIEQMSAAVTAVNPTGPVPSMIGGIYRDDPDAQVVSATVQSLQSQKSLAALGVRDLVICDEAHHSPAASYRKVFEHFAGARRAGFTATMTRLAPVKGEPTLREIWSKVVYERDLVWAVDSGFLIAPHGVTVELPELDVSSIHAGSGEITDGEAELAMMRDATLNATVDAVAEHTAGLSTIVFGASVPHCRKVTEALNGVGVSAEMVVGPTSPRERSAIYRRFNHGETHVLVTVDVLTEGADFPRCEAVVLARPTRSQSRLVQCVGRALRPYTFDGGRIKDRALVVDLVGAGSLGLIVETELDKEHTGRGSTQCECDQPCFGSCGDTCRGSGCGCRCDCGTPLVDEEDDDLKGSIVCTCECSLPHGLCRCGCLCDAHRIDPLVTFDPVTGQRETTKLRRGDSPWSQRTRTIRWSKHDRGLARPVYRQTGSKGVLMLADMRGVAGSVPGRDWALGFYDNDLRRMFWVNTSGQWQQPGPTCHLQGYTLAEADMTATALFDGHMKDQPRKPPSAAQVSFAKAHGIDDAESLDRRDLSDMFALSRAEEHLPRFTTATTDDD